MFRADSADVLHEADQTARRIVGAGPLNSPISTESTFIVKDIRGITARYVLRRIVPVLIRAREQAASKQYAYGELGDVQENLGRAHVLRVWVRRPTGWKAIVYQEAMSLGAPPVTARACLIPSL
jgi:hypothetical protein